MTSTVMADDELIAQVYIVTILLAVGGVVGIYKFENMIKDETKCKITMALMRVPGPNGLRM